MGANKEDGLDDGKSAAALARDAYSELALAERWDFWLVVEWAYRLDAVTAQGHIDRLVSDLCRKSPGLRLLAGIHRHPMLHAHAVLKLSRRLRARYQNASEVRDWLRAFWYHGPVWVALLDRKRLASEHRAGGGAARYLARDPGTVSR